MAKIGLYNVLANHREFRFNPKSIPVVLSIRHYLLTINHCPLTILSKQLFHNFRYRPAIGLAGKFLAGNTHNLTHIACRGGPNTRN